MEKSRLGREGVVSQSGKKSGSGREEVRSDGDGDVSPSPMQASHCSFVGEWVPTANHLRGRNVTASAQCTLFARLHVLRIWHN